MFGPRFAASLSLASWLQSGRGPCGIAPLRVCNSKIGVCGGGINDMSQGLCMFDGNERLVVCNHRYMQMYSLSADIVTPGSTLHSLLEYGSGTRTCFTRASCVPARADRSHGLGQYDQ